MLHNGPAGQLEFESNRLAIYKIKAKKFRSFLRQAHNQITIRYKRQALYNNKRTKVWLVCYRFLIQPPRACMRVCASAIINTLNKLTLSAKKVGGQLPPLPPRLRGPCSKCVWASDIQPLVYTPRYILVLVFGHDRWVACVYKIRIMVLL